MHTPRKLRIACLLLGLSAAFAGCSHAPPRQQVLVPPRMDLARYGTLGLVEFASPDGDGMGAHGAREFLAALHAAQPGTPVLELGAEAGLLRAVGRPALDPEAVHALGEKYHVDALIVGTLDSQRVSPKLAFDSGAAFATAKAVLDGSLDVRILETRAGATVWSTVSNARAELGGVELSSRGLASSGSSSPDDARQRLVSRLVRDATDDFWAHWQ